MEEFPVDFIPLDSLEYVFTTHITNPEHFYVHVESRSKILDEVMETLAERYLDLGSSDKPLLNMKLGSLCAAKFTDDNNWYRARITGMMKTGMIEVQFVDYGNTDYVTSDRIKALDQDLVHYPIQSYRCALSNVHCSQGYWTPEATIKFEDEVMDQRCQAYFEGKTNDDTYLVNMRDGDGNNLNQMFGAPESSSKGQKSATNADVFPELKWEKGSKVHTTVAYVQSPDVFWCQDQSFANELLILSEELSRLHMTQTIQPLRDVRPGVTCAAKFSEDEAWYRGVIKSIMNDAAKVYFVDYGNTELVPLDLICKLSPDMKTMPALAVKCRLSGIGPSQGEWDPSVVEEFEEFVVDKEFETTICERDGSSCTVKLVDIVENTDVGSQMLTLLSNSKGAPVTTRKDDKNESSSSHDAGLGPSFNVGSSVGTFLSWVDNPGDFWVQLKEYDGLVEKLSSELQSFYSQPRPGANFEPGSFVVARYSEDMQWYRGLVLKDIDEETVLVLFIDYGNSDVVEKAELRQVSPQFGEVVPLAFRCALLDVKPLEGERAWTTDAKNFLEELTQDGCHCDVLSETGSRKLVRLTASGKDVAMELISLRVVAGASSAKPTQCPKFNRYETVQTSEKLKVTVTHVNSPKDFWCQLNKNVNSLDNLMERLESHYSDEGGTPISNPTVGQACIAQYSEDNAWYRGTIIGVSSSRYNVQFVDYGNCEVVPGNLVCEPEPRFLDFPVQGVHCSLPLQGDTSHLSDAMSDLVMEKELTLEVLDGGQDIARVELYDSTSKISDVLKRTTGSAVAPKQSATNLAPATPITRGSTVAAFTSYVVSPSQFYIQLAAKEEELSVLMDDIAIHNASVDGPKPLTNPQVGQACMALFSEDNLWYRGIIKSLQGSKCMIFFVDYGNEEEIGTDKIRVLPPEFSAVPIMAYECCIEGAEHQKSWSEEAKEFFESTVMDQELQCTFVTETVVKIISNGSNLNDGLATQGHVKTSEATSKPNSFGSPSSGTRSDGGFGDSPRKGGSFGGEGGKAFGEKKGGWSESGSDRSTSNGFGSKRDGSGSGFGSRREDSGSGFGSRRDDSGSGFGSRREEPASGFGKRRDGDNDRNTSVQKELTYGDIPSDSQQALLVHMDEDGTFYLQLNSMERTINQLAKRLAGSYKNGGGPRLRDTPAKGVACCAKFPDDGCMYRALIHEVNGRTAVLRYVDYGNMAECNVQDLKLMFPDFFEYSMQAFPCILKGLKWSLDQAEKFGSATLDKTLDVTFLGSSPPFEVEVKTPHGDLLDIMTGKVSFDPNSPAPGGTTSGKGGFGAGAASPPRAKSDGSNFSKSSPKSSGGSFGQPQKPQVPEQKYNSQVSPSGTVDAYICHIDEDGYFYLQLEKDTALLDTISAELEQLPRGNHPNPIKDAACAATFSEDSAVYRAKIIESKREDLTVTFVDFGNGDVVKKNSVKPLSKSLLVNAPLAYKSQFGELGPLAEDAQTKLSEYLMEHKVSVTFVKGAGPPYDVAMVDSEGNDIQEVLSPSDNYKSQRCPKDVTPAGVSHIEDDGSFFAQLYGDFPAISNLQQKLSELASSTMEKIDSPEVGSACFYTSEEGLGHRGQIKERLEGSSKVMDVDTGKTSVVEDNLIFKLPLELFKVPPFGYQCRLKGVEKWTEDLREKFTDMTDGKILNATFYTSSSPFRVSLARSIELDLLGLSAPLPDSPVREKPKQATNLSAEATEAGSEQADNNSYVSHVDGDGTLYIQSQAAEDELNNMSEKLEEALAAATTGDFDPATRTIGSLVCAKFTEDDAWYRALVESVNSTSGEVTVRFVDYGNTDTIGADRLAAVPDGLDLQALKPFARKCRLSGVGELTAEEVEKLRESIVDQVVVVVSSGQGKNGVEEVELTIAGTPVTQLVGVTVDDKKAAAGASSYVTHIDEDGTLYIQSQAMEDELSNMSEKLEEALAAGTIGNLDPATQTIGTFICAKFTEDDAWYRALVESVDSTSGEVTVRFVDYGNTDTIGADRLAAVPDGLDLQALKPFARKCRLSGVSELTAEEVEKLRESVEDQVVVVISSGQGNNGIEEVELSVAGTLVTQLVGLQVADKVVAGVNSCVSHTDDDGTLYIQTQAMEDELNNMSEKLEEALAAVTTGDLDPATLTIGTFICAKFTEDDAWYRALVEAVDSTSGEVTVRFVDYGNTDTIGADRLAAVPDGVDLQAFKPFARKCRLLGVDELTAEEVEKLRESVEDQVVVVVSSGQGKNGVEEVELTVAGTPVIQLVGVTVDDKKDKSSSTDQEFVDATELAEANLNQNAEAEEFVDAKEVEADGELDAAEVEADGEIEVEKAKSLAVSDIGVTSGSRVSVTVTFATSPSKFYFQLNESQAQYTTLMDEMFEHFSSLPEGEGTIGDTAVAVGDMCAALFSEDESWYRAAVKSEVEGSYSIFFVDYGNTEEVDVGSLRQLPEHFKSLPPAAKEGCLVGVKPVESEWSEDAVEEFKGMVLDKSLLADIQGSSEGATVLRLLELGIPVHEELIKKGYAEASEEITISQTVQQVFSDANETFQESEQDVASQKDEQSKLEEDQVQEVGSPKSALRIGSLANTVEELKAVSVFVSSTRSPSLFWCQLSTGVDTLEEISSAVKESGSTQDQLDSNSINIGDFVVAKSPLDGLLYRCKVLRQAEEGDDKSFNFFLQFIDFGTESEVGSENIYTMEEKLFQYPAQAIKCCLDNVRPEHGESWSEQSCQKFLEIVEDKELSLKLVGRDQDDTLLVELMDSQSDQSVAKLLVGAVEGCSHASDSTQKNQTDVSRQGDVSTFENLELTRPILESTTVVNDTTQAIVQRYTIQSSSERPFGLHTEYDVTVCNNELPNSFHVRLLEMDVPFKSLKSEIQSYIDSDEGAHSDEFSPTTNEACLVSYENSWHRGIVLAKSETDWSVKLQDSGVETSVGQASLRSLPQELMELPAQAVPCYLAGIVSVEPEWCPDAIAFFKDFVGNGKFCMYVLEDADDSKYGVCMNEIDCSDSNSLNRTMVDLGYAEVVPGSNIDIQIEMEKTLDTDMLNDLEESFNEVAQHRCNAEDKAGKNSGMTESGDATSHFENDGTDSCRKDAESDPCEAENRPYDGNNGVDDIKTASSEEKPTQQVRRFSLAVDVERIEQNGCPDGEVDNTDIEEKDADVSCDQIPAVKNVADQLGHTEGSVKSDERDSGANIASLSELATVSLYTWKSESYTEKNNDVDESDKSKPVDKGKTQVLEEKETAESSLISKNSKAEKVEANGTQVSKADQDKGHEKCNGDEINDVNDSKDFSKAAAENLINLTGKGMEILSEKVEQANLEDRVKDISKSSEYSILTSCGPEGTGKKEMSVCVLENEDSFQRQLEDDKGVKNHEPEDLKFVKNQIGSMCSTPMKPPKTSKAKNRDYSAELADKTVRNEQSLVYLGTVSEIVDPLEKDMRGIEGGSNNILLEDEEFVSGSKEIHGEDIEASYVSHGVASLSETNEIDDSNNEASHFISCLDVSHNTSDQVDVFNELKNSDPASSCQSENGKQLMNKGKKASTSGKHKKSHTVSDSSEDGNSLDHTQDEYESCSETGPDDSVDHQSSQYLDSVKRNVVSQNLSSFMTHSSEQDQQQSDFEASSSQLLSGSSFDSSVVTSDSSLVTVETSGTLDDFSSFSTVESSAVDLQTSSSSSSSDMTSCHTSSTVSSNATAENTSVASVELTAESLDNGDDEQSRACQNVDNGDEQSRISQNVDNGDEQSRISQNVDNGDEQSRISQNVDNGDEQSRISQNVDNGDEQSRISQNVDNGDEQCRASQNDDNDDEQSRASQNVDNGDEQSRTCQNVDNDDDQSRASQNVDNGNEQFRASQNVDNDDEQSRASQNEQSPSTNKLQDFSDAHVSIDDEKKSGAKISQINEEENPISGNMRETEMENIKIKKESQENSCIIISDEDSKDENLTSECGALQDGEEVDDAYHQSSELESKADMSEPGLDEEVVACGPMMTPEDDLTGTDAGEKEPEADKSSDLPDIQSGADDA